MPKHILDSAENCLLELMKMTLPRHEDVSPESHLEKLTTTAHQEINQYIAFDKLMPGVNLKMMARRWEFVRRTISHEWVKPLVFSGSCSDFKSYATGDVCPKYENSARFHRELLSNSLKVLGLPLAYSLSNEIGFTTKKQGVGQPTDILFHPHCHVIMEEESYDKFLAFLRHGKKNVANGKPFCKTNNKYLARWFERYKSLIVHFTCRRSVKLRENQSAERYIGYQALYTSKARIAKGDTNYAIGQHAFPLMYEGEKYDNSKDSDQRWISQDLFKSILKCRVDLQYHFGGDLKSTKRNEFVQDADRVIRELELATHKKKSAILDEMREKPRRKVYLPRPKYHKLPIGGLSFDPDKGPGIENYLAYTTWLGRPKMFGYLPGLMVQFVVVNENGRENDTPASVIRNIFGNEYVESSILNQDRFINNYKSTSNRLEYDKRKWRATKYNRPPLTIKRVDFNHPNCLC